MVISLLRSSPEPRAKDDFRFRLPHDEQRHVFAVRQVVVFVCQPSGVGVKNAHLFVLLFFALADFVGDELDERRTDATAVFQ